MMAFEIKKPGSGAATYTTDSRVERAARRRSNRLTEPMANDLRYVWAGVSADMGLRSAHGAVEARLMMAAPRDVSAPILEELQRLGGWVCEGRLLRIVCLDTQDRPARGIPGELKRSLRELVRDGRVSQRAMPMPDVKAPALRTPGEQLQIEQWTGFEVRLVSMRLGLAFVPITREERWARQDEALEREHHLMHGSETLSMSTDFDPPENVQMSRVNRARSALDKLSWFDRKVLQAMYGENRATEADEITAVRFLVGGDETIAEESIEAACSAYREACGK